nr:hypothetical protein [Sulfurimonas aquatica]
MFETSALRIKKITPKVDRIIPMVWYEFIFCFKIKKDIKSTKIGTVEFIIRAFVEVVVVSPKYKRVLNAVIPRIDRIAKILKFCFREFSMFLRLLIKIGDIIKKTNNHLKKANSKGVTSSFIYLPMIKFTDQNSTHSVIKK